MFNLNFLQMKKLFVAALAVLALVSCSKETPGNQDGQKAYVSFGITQSGVTRATEAPTSAEQVMEDWTLYIFNNAQSLIKVVDVPAGTTSTGAIELSTGKYFLLFAVNQPGAPNAIPTIALNDNIDVVEKKLMENFTGMTPITTGASKFYITNVKREELTVVAGSSEGSPQSETIQVGRAVAKVRLNPITALTTQSGNGELLPSSVKYLGANNPNAMYAFPHRNGGQLETPYFSDATVTVANYFPTLATVMTGWATPSSTTGDGIYMMENSNSVPKQGNASFLLIEGTYQPETWVLKDGSDAGAYTPGTTFYRVGKKAAPGTNENIATFIPYILSETIANTTEMEAFLEFADPENMSTAGYYTGKGGDYGVEEYVNGVTYYALYIGDQSLGTAAARFTVARNYLYNVTINEITGPGYGDPKTVIVDPEKPIEEQAFLKVTITPAPWELINQGGVLGN